MTLLCLWRSLPQVLAEAGRANRAKNVNTISTESIFLIRCSFRRDVALGEMFVLGRGVQPNSIADNTLCRAYEGDKSKRGELQIKVPFGEKPLMVKVANNEERR